MKTVRFIYDCSEKNADLYYATHFRSPDAFIYFESGGEKFVVLSDLEIDRAKREAAVDHVLSVNTYVSRAEKKAKIPGQADVVYEIFLEQKIKKIIVPQNAPFGLIDSLRNKGCHIEAGPTPFFSERAVKSAEEKRFILDSQKTVFAAMGLARDVLKKSRISGRRLVYRGQALTSERLRREIDIFLYENGYIVEGTIVSCGLHAIDPHDVGTGPLTPHSSIIVDIFPHSKKTGYFGDATRTFCRGRASDALRQQYAAVKGAQECAMKLIRPGINGRKVHEAVHSYFSEQGFKTGEEGGRRQGFFHGTGHSIGLEVHEEPARITFRDYILQAGSIMSCEPGLYYASVGGVRIEDLVFITKDGCEVLGKFPKMLEV